MKKFCLTLSLTLLILTITSIDCRASEFVYGPYTVGFDSYKTFDDSRFYFLAEDTIFRPLLIHVWHPTLNKNEGQTLTFKHYIDLIAQREDYGKSSSEINENSFNYVKAYSEFAKRNLGLDTSIQTKEILNSPVLAKSGIPIKNMDSELPLLIYAPSNSKSSVQNHMICEYLASHGFIILSVASAGSSSIRRENIGKSTMAQVKDMEYILKYCEDSLNIKYTTLGLFGFSSGGLATTIFQMRNDSVGAVFSMDGGQEYGAYNGLYKMTDYNPEKADVPYCSIVNNYEDFSIYPFYTTIHSAEKYLIQMPYLNHNGFISHWRFFESCSPNSTLSQTGRSYDYMSKCALRFFSKYLKSVPAFCDSTLLTGMDKEYIRELRPDNSSIIEIGNALLNNDSVVAANMMNENKTRLAAKETEINILARMLMDAHIDHATWLSSSNVEMHPDSWKAHYNLGYVFKVKGEKVLAKKELLRAAELNPDESDIAILLKELNQLE